MFDGLSLKYSENVNSKDASNQQVVNSFFKSSYKGHKISFWFAYRWGFVIQPATPQVVQNSVVFDHTVNKL
jgi:hypothetical protein